MAGQVEVGGGDSELFEAALEVGEVPGDLGDADEDATRLQYAPRPLKTAESVRATIRTSMRMPAPRT